MEAKNYTVVSFNKQGGSVSHCFTNCFGAAGILFDSLVTKLKDGTELYKVLLAEETPSGDYLVLKTVKKKGDTYED